MEKLERRAMNKNAEAIQDALLGLWSDGPDALMNLLDGTAAESFEEAGVLTSNAGILIRTGDGHEFQITIVQSR